MSRIENIDFFDNFGVILRNFFVVVHETFEPWYAGKLFKNYTKKLNLERSSRSSFSSILSRPEITFRKNIVYL